VFAEQVQNFFTYYVEGSLSCVKNHEYTRIPSNADEIRTDYLTNRNPENYQYVNPFVLCMELYFTPCIRRPGVVLQDGENFTVYRSLALRRLRMLPQP